MIINAYRFNRKKEKINMKEINLSKFEKIGITEDGFALKYKKGKSVFLYAKTFFDDYERLQALNDAAVKNRTFSYKKIDENKSSSADNIAKDEKGRPVKIYESPKDYFVHIKNRTFIDNSTCDVIRNYAENKKKLYSWNDNKYE